MNMAAGNRTCARRPLRSGGERVRGAIAILQIRPGAAGILNRIGDNIVVSISSPRSRQADSRRMLNMVAAAYRKNSSCNWLWRSRYRRPWSSVAWLI